MEGPRPFGACHSQQTAEVFSGMILFVALGISLTSATALLVQPYRSRALADADAPPGDAPQPPLDGRRAA